MSAGANRVALVADYISAAQRYWLEVFPRLQQELRAWTRQAQQIPNAILRQLALQSLHAKRGNIEGAAAFAVFVAPRYQATVLRALIAYQVAFDYLDVLAEQPNGDPIRNGHHLHQALLVASRPSADHVDYYVHNRHKADGGYLRTLVDACRIGLSSLPSYGAVARSVHTASARIVAYQSLNHGDAKGSHYAFEQWAREQTRTYKARFAATDLKWWEIGAAAGSSLSIFALIAAAAGSTMQSSQIAAIEDAYFPWIGALNSLFDSFLDQHEDAAPHQNQLLNYYASNEEAMERLQAIMTGAMQHTQRLPTATEHTMMLAAMTSFYLSAAKELLIQDIEEDPLLKTMGILATPLALTFRLRRGVRQVGRRLVA